MKFDSKTMKYLSLISQVGINMFVPIFGCMLLGHFLDERLNTSPIILIVFTIIGVLSAFRNLFVLGIRLSNDHGKKDDDYDD